MTYLERLKKFKTHTVRTVLTAKTPFDSFGSSVAECFYKLKPSFGSFDSNDAGHFHKTQPVKKHTNKQEEKVIPQTDPGRVSPVALAWLRSNKAALRQAGWTAPELYRRNKSRGIAWLMLWGKPSLLAYLEPGGLIRFEFIDDIGRGVTQTARPMFKNNSHFLGANNGKI